MIKTLVGRWPFCIILHLWLKKVKIPFLLENPRVFSFTWAKSFMSKECIIDDKSHSKDKQKSGKTLAQVAKNFFGYKNHIYKSKREFFPFIIDESFL